MAREREGKMKGTVKCDLYFRSEPKKEAANIITYLEKGKEITILEDQGEWLKVKVGNKHGHVMAEFVDIAPEDTGTPGTEDTGTPGTEDPGAPGTPEQLEIEKDKAVGEIDKDGNYLIDGKIVGKVDGDNILITDPDIIAETLAEMKKEDGKDE